MKLTNKIEHVSEYAYCFKLLTSFAKVISTLIQFLLILISVLVQFFFFKALDHVGR